MRSSDRWAPRPARSFLVALPLLALALLLASPAFAHAETNNEKVYEPALPSIESGSSTKPAETKAPAPHHAKPKVTHHPTPQATGEESTETATEPTAEPKTAEHHRAAAAPAAKGGNQPPGGGKPGGDSHQSPAKNVTPKSEGPTSTKVDTSGSGGSSPVVPILIAVLVLAALSIGIVVYRERRSVAA